MPEETEQNQITLLLYILVVVLTLMICMCCLTIGYYMGKAVVLQQLTGHCSEVEEK